MIIACFHSKKNIKTARKGGMQTCPKAVPTLVMPVIIPNLLSNDFATDDKVTTKGFSLGVDAKVGKFNLGTNVNYNELNNIIKEKRRR